MEANDGVDRISSLPDHLLHKITSLLPPESAAQTSIFSKRWLRLWCTSPIIDLREARAGKHPTLEGREVFCRFVETIVARHEMEHLERLTLETESPIDHRLENLVTDLLEIAMESRTYNIDICFVLGRRGHLKEGHYFVPEAVFISDSLISLALKACRVDQTNRVELHALKDLSLSETIIADHMLVTLLDGCPIIDNFAMTNCNGLIRPTVTSRRMKTLSITNCPDIISVNLNVPLLEQLTYEGNMNALRLQSMSGCPLLTFLVLSYVTMDAISLENLISSFPCVQSLTISNCCILNIAKSSIMSLQVLEMANCRIPGMDLPFITPNLEFLRVANFLEIGYFGPYLKIKMKNIRSLTLGSNIRLDPDMIENIMNEFQFLEHLSLMFCNGLNQLIIISDSLKTLSVLNCPHLTKFQIEAPNLILIKYIGSSFDLIELNASDELSADILILPFHLYHQIRDETLVRILNKLIRRFPHIEDVTIIDKASPVWKVRDEQLIMKKPRHLVFRTTFLNIQMETLFTQLFSDLTIIQTFSIFMETFSIEMKFKEYFAERSDKKRRSFRATSPDCIQDQLTDIMMENFKGNEEEMQILELLLDRALLLEFVSIVYEGRCTKNESVYILERIAEMHKISGDVQIFFSPNLLEDI